MHIRDHFAHAPPLTHASDRDSVDRPDYARRIIAMIARRPLAAVPFHPETSLTLVLSLLAKFLRWRP